MKRRREDENDETRDTDRDEKPVKIRSEEKMVVY